MLTLWDIHAGRKLDPSPLYRLPYSEELAEMEQAEDLSPHRLGRVVEELLAGQNPMAALVAGVAAALFGILAGGVGLVRTSMPESLVLILLGGLVGATVRVAGHGVRRGFSFLGAGLALGAALVARTLPELLPGTPGVPVSELLRQFADLRLETVLSSVPVGFDLRAWFSCLTATIAAYSLSRRKLSAQEVMERYSRTL